MALGALAEPLTDLRGHALRRPWPAATAARPGGAEWRARIEHQLDAVEAHLAAVAQHPFQRTVRIIAPEANTERDFHWSSSCSWSGRAVAPRVTHRSLRPKGEELLPVR